ncbi:MAG: hypothetical protein IRZ19_00980 [Pyrinomonas methylaliphatogenes]|jgi:mercuric ion transport protein|nr:hypothetical protein [Pyrinomonas methylaliphatogenes]
MRTPDREKIFAFGSVVAAVAASLCCLAPLLFALFGLGAFSAAATFEAARPYFLTLAALLLAGGFLYSFRSRKTASEKADGCCATGPKGSTHLGLWLAILAMIAAALAPYYAGALFHRLKIGERRNSLLQASAGGPSAAAQDSCYAATRQAELEEQTVTSSDACCATTRKGEASVTQSSTAISYSKDLTDLKEEFNRDKGKIRLVALLSPTCPGCAGRGASELRDKVLAKIKSEDLRIYVVWEPCLPTDDEMKVPAAAARLNDARVRHYWDARGELRGVYQRLMKMSEPAWDVYYVYDRDVEWRAEPPTPNYYMHQLRTLPPELLLDGDRLAAKVNAMLQEGAR